MTLIEVLAALSLLGSLAVAMVLSRGRLVEQHRMAQQKMDAVNAADELLMQWWSGEAPQVPVGTNGELEDHPQWSWQTEVVDNRSLTVYDAQVVRLSIFDVSVAGLPVELTSIDLVLPRQLEAGRP